MRSKTLQSLLGLVELNNDNLHRIAISNLHDHERKVIRWWTRKYRTPQKPLFEHTMEELIIEMLEDYYEQNPVEIHRFEANELAMVEVGWDGSVPEEYERGIQERLQKLRKIDLTRFQDDKVLTPEEEQKILDSLGQNLPGSHALPKRGEVVDVPTLGEDFEDEFGA